MVPPRRARSCDGRRTRDAAPDSPKVPRSLLDSHRSDARTKKSFASGPSSRAVARNAGGREAVTRDRTAPSRSWSSSATMGSPGTSYLSDARRINCVRIKGQKGPIRNSRRVLRRPPQVVVVSGRRRLGRPRLPRPRPAHLRRSSGRRRQVALRRRRRVRCSFCVSSRELRLQGPEFFGSAQGRLLCL